MKNVVTTLALIVACFSFSTVSTAMADDGDVLATEETTVVVEPTDTPSPLDSWLLNPTFECETWKVPGWLNDEGIPTSCVDNAPCPEARESLPCPADIPAVETVVLPVTPVEAPVTPSTPVDVVTVAPIEVPLAAPVNPAEEVTPVVEATPMLAETGIPSGTWVALFIAGLAMAMGIVFMVRHIKI